ncbi:MAG: BCCT family transporter [Paracoccaceae bacterium]
MKHEIPQERLLFFPKVNRVVFTVSAVLIVGFILFGAIFNETANTIFSGAQSILAGYAGWLLVIEVNILVLFALFVALGPFGDIRLGRMDESPEYDMFSWVAMLFSAGIGIGLIYWGVAEPMYHFFSPPLAEAESQQAATDAMVLSFLHWGFHGWAVYVVVGLALAYYHFRKGLPLTIRSALYPLIGDRIYGPWGDLVDILAVFGTMFGIVTSLGLGAMQINSGLGTVLGIEQSVTVQVLIIAGITFMATMSVMAGLDGGIKRLSNINIVLSFLLLVFMLAVGPTLFIFDSYVENYGNYLSRFLSIGFWNEGWTGGEWQNSWTIFYWAWWISWSPFVGMFIARVSRGRTIREFVLGVLLIPCSIMFFWFTAFGGTAIKISMEGDRTLIEATQNSYGDTMFALLDYYPLAEATSVFAILLIVMWFVTSSDSGSFVIDMLTAGGDPDPPKIQRLFWATTEGAVAAVLLLAGGLNALQAAAVVAGFPFAIIVALMAVALWRALRWDALMIHRHKQRYRSDAEAEHNMPSGVPEDMRPPAAPSVANTPSRMGESVAGE